MFVGAPLALQNSCFCGCSNKLLLFVSATKGVASTGRASARRKAKRYASEGFEVLPQGSTIRIARPTDNLQEIAEQYSTGLGFKVLGSFEDHDGFNGIMIGHDLQPYHLEFTHHIGTEVGRAPTQDNLLVFYIPDSDQWAATCASMSSAGFKEVVSYNPYWDRIGKTFEDLDGYRVVLQNA